MEIKYRNSDEEETAGGWKWVEEFPKKGEFLGGGTGIEQYNYSKVGGLAHAGVLVLLLFMTHNG